MKKIINIIALTLGVACFVGGLLTMGWGLTYAHKNTAELGVIVAYAKQNIPAGTSLTMETAPQYISVKRIAKADAVDAAILTTAKQENPVLFMLKQLFTNEEPTLDTATISRFAGVQAMTNLTTNMQLEPRFFSADAVSPEERIFSLAMDYTLGMGGEIRVGDLVDLWLYRAVEGHPGSAEKVISGVQVYKVKGEEGVDITSVNAQDRPTLVLFRLSEDNIALIRKAQGEGSVFFVKHVLEG